VRRGQKSVHIAFHAIINRKKSSNANGIAAFSYFDFRPFISICSFNLLIEEPKA
jgi:hypothetical protein